MTDVFFDTALIKGIIKSNVSDHFQIFSSIEISNRKKLNHTIVVQKLNLSSRNIQRFQTELPFVKWEFVNNIKDSSSIYEELLIF